MPTTSKRFVLLSFAINAGLLIGASIAFSFIVPRGAIAVLGMLVAAACQFVFFYQVWRMK